MAGGRRVVVELLEWVEMAESEVKRHTCDILGRKAFFVHARQYIGSGRDKHSNMNSLSMLTKFKPKACFFKWH